MAATVDIRKQWSVAQENLLQELAQRCQSRSVMHGMEYRVYKRLNTLITVPSIVITLFGGAASTSQSSLVDLIGPSSEKYVPLVIGVLSMFVSIMGSVSSFMKIPALTEQHLQAHISFGKLTRKISGDIQVSPCDRSMPGREACKKYEEHFVALMDIAPPVSRRTESRFSSRSDVKALKMVVPPLVKMGIVKTFTQLETERVAATEKAKALLQAEIARASQPPKLRRGISRRFGDGGRTRVSPPPPPVSIEMPPMSEAPATIKRVGTKKLKRELRNELSSIAQVGRVSRLASTGGLVVEKASDSESDSSEEEVRVETEDNSLDQLTGQP
jgi:plasmid stabilization system protein ParE